MGKGFKKVAKQSLSLTDCEINEGTSIKFISDDSMIFQSQKDSEDNSHSLKPTDLSHGNHYGQYH